MSRATPLARTGALMRLLGSAGLALALLAFGRDANAAATLVSAASQTFAVGQTATAASNPTVTEDAFTPRITAANGLRIRIPAGLAMTWDTTVTTVTLSGTAAAKVSTTLLAYEDSNKTLVLNVTTNFTAGQTLTVSGLKFANFSAVSSSSLQLVTAGTGGVTADTDSRTKTIQIPAPTLSSALSQTFSIGQPATAASNPTITDDPLTPGISATSDIRIRIPAGLAMTWDTAVTTVTLSGSAAAKVSTTLLAYEDSGKTLVLNVTANFAAGDTLTVSGLRFANFTATSSDNLELVTAGAGGVAVDTDSRSKSVQNPTATLSSASSQTFSIGQPVTAASNPTVTDDAGVPVIKAAQDIRIRIPAGLSMIWDTTVTTVTLSGTAAAKVSTTLLAYEDSSRTLVLNVTADFVAGDTLTVSGLRFTNFSAVSNGNLQLVTAGSGGATMDSDNRSKTIQTPKANLSSASSQTFSLGQAAAAASNLTVTEDAGVPVITAANDIRIRIPGGLAMVWDTTVTTVTLTGTASAKLSTTLAAYEDSGKTLVLNVTTNFVAGDTLTIAGPKFSTFSAVSTGNLQLVTTGAGGSTMDSDNRTKTIQTITLSSAADQTFMVWQATTDASDATITDDTVTPVVKAAQDIRIRIPAALAMTWDPTVTTVTLTGTASAKVSTTLLPYEDGNKTLVLNVTSNFTGGQTLTISGPKFSNFSAVSTGQLELVTTGAGGVTAAADDTTKTIEGVKLYFHNATTTVGGTLPGATSLSATTPSVTATGASTNRDMDTVIGTAEVSATLTTLSPTTLQKNWFRRFLSKPLEAQTLPTGVWTIQGGALESSSNANMLAWGAVIKVWRPSTGAVVATLLDNPLLGTTEPGTSESNISTATPSIAGVAVNQGDVLVIELWAQNTQGSSGARTNTIYYNGTTEGATTSNAAFLQAPGGITFYVVPPGPDHYELVAPTSSINCLPTTLIVTACTDSSSPCTNAYTGVSGTSASLSTSGATLGSGTVTFNASGVATTTLSYPTATNGTLVSVTLSGEQTAAINPRRCCPNGTGCSAANSCSTTFNKAGFVVSAAAGGAAATVASQTAGTASGTYYLRAVQTSTTTAACVSALTGANTVNWAYECNNPGTCSASNLMSINGGTPTTVQRNNNASVASYTSVPMTFDANGNAPFTFTFSDVGQTTLWANKTINSALLSGSSNAFVTKPAGFVLSAIAQTASPNLANPAAASAAGAKFVKAGESFSATVTARTSGGAATPNYGKETSPEGVLLTRALVLPAGGATGALSNATITGGSFSNGVATVSNLAFSEVGIITLTPGVADGDYLGAGAVTGTTSANVGRFVPAQFALSVSSITPRVALACSPASSFNYLGENLRLAFTLTAQSASGTTTQNYSASFAKLDPSSAAGFNLAGRDGTTVFTTASGRLSLGTASGSWSNGVASAITLVANATRAAAPEGPYSAALGIAPVDSDGVGLAAFDMASASGGGNDRASLGTLALRWGRLRLGNALGAQTRALSLPLAAQYWTGTAFDTNLQDSCSTLASTAVSVGNLRKTLTAADAAVTTANLTLSAGVSRLTLAAPVGRPLRFGRRGPEPGQRRDRRFLPADLDPDPRRDHGCQPGVSAWRMVQRELRQGSIGPGHLGPVPRRRHAALPAGEFLT